MSVIGTYPLVLEQNADRPAIVFTWYPTWAPGNKGTPFNFSGYTASAMFRINVADVSPALTLTPTLGGVAGTLTIPTITASQVNTLYALLPSNASLWWDCIITSGGGAITRWIDHSKVTISPAVTR